MTGTLKIDLQDARRVFIGLFGAQILLLCLHLAAALIEAAIGEQVRVLGFLDMDRERNLPTWFAGAQLLTIGVLAMLIGRLRDLEPPPSRVFFILAGLLFFFLSIDEITGLHEKITLVTKGVDWVPHLPGHRGVWVFLYLPLGLVLVVAAHRHLFALWRHHRSEGLILALGLGTYLVGTAGFDVYAILAFPNKEPWFLYRMQVAGEESLEMLGANLMIWAGLRLLVQMSPREWNGLPST